MPEQPRAQEVLPLCLYYRQTPPDLKGIASGIVDLRRGDGSPAPATSRTTLLLGANPGIMDNFRNSQGFIRETRPVPSAGTRTAGGRSGRQAWRLHMPRHMGHSPPGGIRSTGAQDHPCPHTSTPRPGPALPTWDPTLLGISQVRQSRRTRLGESTPHTALERAWVDGAFLFQRSAASR